MHQSKTWLKPPLLLSKETEQAQGWGLSLDGLDGQLGTEVEGRLGKHYVRGNQMEEEEEKKRGEHARGHASLKQDNHRRVPSSGRTTTTWIDRGISFFN